MSLDRNKASIFGFGIRLVVFLLLPIFYDESGGIAAAIAGFIAIVSLLLDILVGKTVWVTAHLLVWLINSVFLIALWLSLQLTGLSSLPLMAAALVLLVALGSDAISNSRRWKLLVPASVLFWMFYVITAPSVYPASVGLQRLLIPYPLMVYCLIPALASLSRLFFPRTKNLIHTSLDYPPVRLEILSMGMKRVAAVGIRRNQRSWQ